MNFVPSLPIMAAVVALALLPVALAGLSHGPWKVAPAGRRFLIASASAVAFWMASLLFLSETTAPDLVAGAMIILGGVLAEFTIWTLIAWGFTVSMLMTLTRTDRDTSVQEWVSGYTGGRTIEAFAEDRLGVLFRFGLAARESGRVVMTPGRGLRTARLAGLLRSVFGLNR